MTYQNDTGLVSVTECFSPYVTWDHISPTVLQQASERGTRVHEAIADELNGEYAMLPADEQGYLDAARRFLEQVVQACLIERRLISAVWGFTGQLDLVAQIKGDTDYTVIDWKTSSIVSKSWGLQGSAYRHLASTEAPIHRVMAVQLRKNGTFKVNEYTNWDRDFHLFLNCLTVYRFFKPKAKDINWEVL